MQKGRIVELRQWCLTKAVEIIVSNPLAKKLEAGDAITCAKELEAYICSKK